MKLLKHITLLSFIVFTFGVVFVSQPASAIDVNIGNSCTYNDKSSVCAGKNDNANNNVKTLINTLIYILGIVTTFVIIIGGVMYTVSGGDASAVKRAKDTILYAVIGLVVAILAFTIVNFVIGRF